MSDLELKPGAGVKFFTSVPAPAKFIDSLQIWLRDTAFTQGRHAS